MKINLTLEEREAVQNKILCVGQNTAEGEEQLWTVYVEGDAIPL